VQVRSKIICIVPVILGFVAGIMMVGNISGAPLTGLVYDTVGSYQAAWCSFAVLAIIGTILAATVPSFSSTVRLSEELAVKSA
jgi:MFS family permease